MNLFFKKNGPASARVEGISLFSIFLCVSGFLFLSPESRGSEIKQESNQNSVSQPANEKKSFSQTENLVEKWDFGVVTDRCGPTKDWKLHPVVVIPNLAGIQYAWKLKLKSKLPVFVREEFTLPEAPSTWKIKEGEVSSELSKGGEQCVLESFQATDEGWIGHAWTASQGDPSGKYEIKIWLNGNLAHVFTFNVGDAPALREETREF